MDYMFVLFLIPSNLVSVNGRTSVSYCDLCSHSTHTAVNTELWGSGAQAWLCAVLRCTAFHQARLPSFKNKPKRARCHSISIAIQCQLGSSSL